jgi:hypothetical protein
MLRRIAAGRQAAGESCSPFNPWATNRCRHLITVFGRVWHWLAISRTRRPARQPKMIWARSTFCFDSVRLAANRSNACRSYRPQLMVGAFLAMNRSLLYIDYHCK